VFDTTTVNPNASGFYGTTFDGRYVYLVPYANSGASFDGVVTRYDTQGSFGSPSAWATFDTTIVDTNARGFEGAAFDGRFLYLVPNGATSSGLTVRFDTQASFTSTASWIAFDMATVDAKAKSFRGATFDGHYIYFIGGSTLPGTGVIMRLDTTASFTSSTSWTPFDPTSLNPDAKGFFGGVFDGRYLYVLPNNNGSDNGLMLRYDTSATFTSPASWTVFDTTTVHSNARGFAGGAFDGRYLYLAPFDNDSARDGVVTRYDTTANFTSTAAWATFDATAINANAKGFVTATFDGRYVYFSPYEVAASTPDGVVARYDTLGGFASSSSWSTFDTSSLDTQAKGYGGSVFDGKYVYFVAYASGRVARFNAKAPPSMPGLPAWRGSFF
jgi:hypothetical protein